MQSFIKTFIATTLAIGVLNGASAQQRKDSSMVTPDSFTVQLKAPIDSSLGGSGTMCGVLSYVNSGLTGNEPCAGIYLNAAWPNPQCPVGHRKIQISGSSQGGNIFGGGSSASSYSCMIQPAGAAPWVQNRGYGGVEGPYTAVCAAATTVSDGEGGVYTVPAKYQIYTIQRALVLMSSGVFLPAPATGGFFGGNGDIYSYSRDDCYVDPNTGGGSN